MRVFGFVVHLQLMSEATQTYIKRILRDLTTIAWQRRGGLSEELLQGSFVGVLVYLCVFLCVWLSVYYLRLGQLGRLWCCDGGHLTIS